MSKAMSLKAKIRNIAKQKNIPAQVILQNYMFERLLVRLSSSEYKEKFILKGGMLVAAIVGLDNRATMDMDTTLKNLPLTPEAIRSALEDVCDIAFDDGVMFEIGTISPIREDDIYGGYRVMLNARFDALLEERAQRSENSHRQNQHNPRTKNLFHISSKYFYFIVTLKEHYYTAYYHTDIYYKLKLITVKLIKNKFADIVARHTTCNANSRIQ